jgi:integrase/recombinase XerD
MKHLSKEQMTALLTVAKQRSERDWLMILTAYWHGLRATEVVNLTHQNLVDGLLTVQRLKGSMRTCQPLIRSSDPLYDESPLEKLTGRFFPLSKRTFERRMKEYGKAAGIPQQFAICHILKHSIAKHALAGGIKLDELKQYLGHKSLASTGAYLQSDDQTASKALAMAAGV